MLRNIREILDFLLPRFCLCCGRRLLPEEQDICLHCMLELPRTRLWMTPSDNALMDAYLATGTVRQAASFVWYYPKVPTASLVHQFKYYGNERLAYSLGRLMAREILAGNPAFFADIDIIVTVPLTLRRHISRGYNQCDALARGISSVTGIPVCGRVLKRRHFNTSQTQLSHIDRWENVIGAFTLGKNASQVEDRHVLLLDDVITTGATTSQCATLLTNIPAASVTILSWGKTVIANLI